eukprot:scaffold2646_cov103-Isochrysis_galbana.AAC.6
MQPRRVRLPVGHTVTHLLHGLPKLGRQRAERLQLGQHVQEGGRLEPQLSRLLLEVLEQRGRLLGRPGRLGPLRGESRLERSRGRYGFGGLARSSLGHPDRAGAPLHQLPLLLSLGAAHVRGSGAGSHPRRPMSRQPAGRPNQRRRRALFRADGRRSNRIARPFLPRRRQPAQAGRVPRQLGPGPRTKLGHHRGGRVEFSRGGREPASIGARVGDSRRPGLAQHADRALHLTLGRRLLLEEQSVRTRRRAVHPCSGLLQPALELPHLLGQARGCLLQVAPSLRQRLVVRPVLGAHRLDRCCGLIAQRADALLGSLGRLHQPLRARPERVHLAHHPGLGALGALGRRRSQLAHHRGELAVGVNHLLAPDSLRLLHADFLSGFEREPPLLLLADGLQDTTNRQPELPPLLQDGALHILKQPPLQLGKAVAELGLLALHAQLALGHNCLKAGEGVQCRLQAVVLAGGVQRRVRAAHAATLRDNCPDGRPTPPRRPTRRSNEPRSPFYFRNSARRPRPPSGRAPPSSAPLQLAGLLGAKRASCRSAQYRTPHATRRGLPWVSLPARSWRARSSAAHSAAPRIGEITSGW